MKRFFSMTTTQLNVAQSQFKVGLTTAIPWKTVEDPSAVALLGTLQAPDPS